MGVGTWGDITTTADEVVYNLSMIDASGDTWVEQLYTAVTATVAAVQAWIILYQITTQASVYKVTREFVWEGAKDASNADFGARFEVKNGINLSFRDADNNLMEPLRVVAPETGDMQGTTDIPVPSSGILADLITATVGIKPTYAFQTAQYTIHRERRGNPKVG